MIYYYRTLNLKEEDLIKEEVRLRKHHKVNGIIVNGIDNVIDFLKENKRKEFKIYLIKYEKDSYSLAAADYYLKSKDLQYPGYIKGDYHEDVMFKDNKTRTASKVMSNHGIKKLDDDYIYYVERDKKVLKQVKIEQLTDYNKYEDYDMAMKPKSNSMKLKNLQYNHDVNMRNRILSEKIS